MAVSHPIEVENTDVPLCMGHLQSEAGHLTIMTMNGFNLDMHVESPSMVKNSRKDVDDDWGDGRFHTLADAVVTQANMPDIVALQEIQDNDGAEISMVVDASATYLRRFGQGNYGPLWCRIPLGGHPAWSWY